jgi:hypothetical protein
MLNKVKIMRNLVLGLAVLFSIVACGEKEDVSPMKVGGNTNSGKIYVESSTDFVIAIGYVNKDKFLVEEPYLITDSGSGKKEFSFTIDKTQNFAYAIQKKDPLDKSIIKARMVFRGHDETNQRDDHDILLDVYEFYPQAY